MTREEKIKGLYSLKVYLVENPIELEGHYSLPITLIDYAIEALEQEPKTGHWINKHHLSFYSCSAECSSCHKRSNGYVHDNGFGLECKYYDFCPNCGADMRR